MKHIRKKFQFDKIVTQGAIDDLNRYITPMSGFSPKEAKKMPKGMKALLLFDTNRLIECFHVNLNGNAFFIPEPDPILIYFNNAYSNYVDIKEVKKNLYKVLSDSITESVANSLYNYFGLTTGFVVFLFTAVEAFINRHIPDEYIYSVAKTKNTETYNKEQIQRYLSFDDKLKKALKEATTKDFTKHFPIKYQHIVNLKEFRDSIVHTKANVTGSTPFDYLYKKGLDFKYEETLLAVRDFMNFYEPDYIIECDCGQDW